MAVRDIPCPGCKKNIKKDIRQIRMSLTSKETRNAKKYRIVFLGDQGVGKTSII